MVQPTPTVQHEVVLAVAAFLVMVPIMKDQPVPPTQNGTKDERVSSNELAQLLRITNQLNSAWQLDGFHGKNQLTK